VKKYSLGLIGYPLEHSISPALHNAALKAMGLDGNYRSYPVKPNPEGEGRLDELFAKMLAGDLHGLNVTIPHKQAVMEFMDELTPGARAIGAVNTIYLQDEMLVGENTDAPGFMHDLQRVTAKYLPEDLNVVGTARSVLILGAGGAARAAAYALAETGWKVFVSARRLEQAHQLVSAVHNSTLLGSMVAVKLDRTVLSRLGGLIDLIVNATPVGMWPEVDDSPWPKSLPLPEKAVLYDMVYNPPVTALVERARSECLAATTGLGMLVEQAALALERWTGARVPRDIMWGAAPDFTLGPK